LRFTPTAPAGAVLRLAAAQKKKARLGGLADLPDTEGEDPYRICLSKMLRKSDRH